MWNGKEGNKQSWERLRDESRMRGWESGSCLSYLLLFIVFMLNGNLDDSWIYSISSQDRKKRRSGEDCGAKVWMTQTWEATWQRTINIHLPTFIFLLSAIFKILLLLQHTYILSLFMYFILVFCCFKYFLVLHHLSANFLWAK